MLIRFSVKNFLSFKESTEFSLFPSKVRKHPEHVYKGKKSNDINVLKTSVIYGPNASGKSNLIKAMFFAQKMIREGIKAKTSIPRTPFKMDNSYLEPSSFEFEIKVKNKNYAYGFIVDDTKIVEEWLYEINKSKDHLLFSINSKNKEQYELGSKLNFDNKKEKQFFEFSIIGKPENRLFLNEFLERNLSKTLPNLSQINDVIDWFDKTLNIIFPNSKYAGLELTVGNDTKITNMLSSFLKSCDTGIEELLLKEINFDQDLDGIPADIKEKIQADLNNNERAIITAPKNRRYQISRNSKGSIEAHKLMTTHLDQDGNKVEFEIFNESDGTQRLLDLAPGLIEALMTESVFIIDEIDRSLHPEITILLLSTFLKTTENSASQLIITTHETNLLNQKLLRKDEIWFMQKLKNGASKLYSLEDFKPRFDKDIRKEYLSGRFGGVPLVTQLNDLEWLGSKNG